MNTLSTSNRTHQPNKLRTHQPNKLGRTWANNEASGSGRLQVVASVGDNVPVSAKGLNECGGCEGPLTKRRKTAPAPRDRSSPRIAGSDGIDELSLQQDLTTSLVRESRKTSQTPSVLSQRKERLKQYFDVQEYHNVENTMNSDPNRKNKWKGRHRKSPAGLVDGGDLLRLPGLKASSAASPIDLSDDEQIQQPIGVSAPPTRYKGTANEAHKDYLAAKNALGRQPVQDTGKTSRHFGQAVTPKIIQIAPVVDVSNRHQQDEVEDQGDRLDNKFRSTNGKRRSGDFASSPDVLNGDTTVGKISRHASPSKSSSSTRKGSPIKESQPGLPPSNISRTAFGAAIKPRTSPGSTWQKQSAQEADAAWGIGLAAVSVRGRLYASKSLGLQYKPELESYDVIEAGKDWADQDLSFRVQLGKLKKVFWSLSDGKVRFESARSEGAENVLDIELCNEKEIKTLTGKLQEKYHHFLVKGEDG